MATRQRLVALLGIGFTRRCSGSLATGERDFAVIGCGAIGLTTAVLLARAGARVTIYAKELPPFTRSSWATGAFSPDSRIALAEYATPIS